MGGAYADQASKGACKVVLMLEPDVNAYVKHTKLWIVQQFLSTLDSLVENIAVRAEAGALSE